MQNWVSKNSQLFLFIIILVVSFLAINIGASLFMGAHKIDLTKEKKYTLSDESVEWLHKNKKTVFIKLYLSPDLDEQDPELGQYTRYVIRFLEQYKFKGNNNINLVVEEVEPYSLEEKEAKNHNIRGWMDKSGKHNLYFGATFSSDEGKSFSIPYFEPKRQNYLEHDVSRILSKLYDYEPKNVAIISPVLDVIEKADNFDDSVDWPFVKQLRNDYNLVYTKPTMPQLPFKTDALIVVNPQNLSSVGVYAIEQYLLRGGRVLIFADPFSEVLLNSQGYYTHTASNLEKFYQNLGLQYEDNVVIGDKLQNQKTVIKTSDNNNRLLDYPLWLELDANHINQSHPLTKGLSKLRFNSAGTFQVGNVKLAKSATLFNSSVEAGSMNVNELRNNSQVQLRDAFKSDGRAYDVGLLLEGTFISSFQKNVIDGSELADLMFPFLMSSIEEGKLLLVSDSDFLFNSNWNQGTNFESPYDYVPISNNMDFVERAVDYLTGNKNILSLAPRNNFNGWVSVGNNLNKIVQDKYNQEFENYNYRAEIAKQDNAILLEKIKKQEVFPSITIIKKMEALQKEMRINQEKIKKLEYKMKEKTLLYRKLIIIFNTFICPFLMIVLFLIIGWLWQRCNKKRALRYTHE